MGTLLLNKNLRRWHAYHQGARTESAGASRTWALGGEAIREEDQLLASLVVECGQERSEYDASEARGIRAVLKASKNAIKQIGNFDFTLYIEARMRVEKSQNGANLRRKMVSIFYRHRGTA